MNASHPNGYTLQTQQDYLDFASPVPRLGSKVGMDVVRVGLFNIIADGKYLDYEASTGNLSELPRHGPKGQITKSTTNHHGHLPSV